MCAASGTRARVGSWVNRWLADVCHEYRGRGPITIGADHLLVRGTRMVVVGGSHLMLTALADPEGAAGRLIHRLGADPASVADELRFRTAP